MADAVPVRPTVESSSDSALRQRFRRSMSPERSPEPCKNPDISGMFDLDRYVASFSLVNAHTFFYGIGD